ncbi:RHS repeat-associated core domain-containing protein [Flavobacterium sp.]|uniref:RHS repeat-associated core domain-containing protein n=1 Tax=Flavobacterium sp. TaxID=239 RepID=UPI00374DB136
MKPSILNFTRGNKFFELSNHLGNVLATISDKKIGHDAGNGTFDYYNADVISATDYYPGGMDMPGRQYNAATGYRYGFNGKEKDNKDGIVQYDYGFRIYDPRLVRFKSVDPLTGSYPYFTPYQFASNNPIVNIDLDGLEGKCVITDQYKEAFIKQHNITSDAQVKYAIGQGQTVVMKLTYATGPDDQDTKEVGLNDGGQGASIMRFDAQTNGINAQWGHYYVEQPPALVKVSGEIEPITIDPPTVQPPNIIPRKSSDIVKKSPNNGDEVTGKKKSPPKINGHTVGKDPVTLSLSVSFDPNTDNINNKGSVMKQAKEIVTAMKDDPKLNVLLLGNVWQDTPGPVNNNPNAPTTLNGNPTTTQGLQTSRAKAVADLLIKQGVNPKQVNFGTGTVSNDKKKGLSTDAVIKRKG